MARLSNKGKRTDLVMRWIVTACGLVMVTIIVMIFGYLARESAYALKQKHTYGFRFSGQDPAARSEEISMDPYSSVITAHTEGSRGLDEKEEGITMPSLEELAGVGKFATGTLVDPTDAVAYRDNWDAPQGAGETRAYTIYLAATPEFKGKTMILQWAPDQGSDVRLTPFSFRLKLVRAPQGMAVPQVEVDLALSQSGEIELPSWSAASDEELTKGYVFELKVAPRGSSVAATTGSFLGRDWGPTLAHPRFGFLPLLFSTVLITLLALLIATPIAVTTAVFLSEQASPRIREWLKPFIELLASVPTVVLGYFGLMLVAPAFQSMFGEALRMESGRSLLTTSVVMAVLIVPTIATFAEDALRSVSGSYRDGGSALGLTSAETIRQIVLPAARGGIIGAVLLGLARAVGETMVVWMLSGGTPRMPDFSSLKAAGETLAGPTRGMADTVAIEMGNVVFEGVHYGYLFAIGLVLFLMTLVVNLMGFRMARRTV